MNTRIYAYADEHVRLCTDPYRVLRDLTIALGGDPGAVLRSARTPDPQPGPGGATDQAALDGAAVERAVAQRRLAEAARAAFDLPPFDRETGEGPLDDDCLAVLYDFAGWLKKKETGGGSSPTSAPPTGSGFSDSPSRTSSDCGCS